MCQYRGCNKWPYSLSVIWHTGQHEKTICKYGNTNILYKSGGNCFVLCNSTGSIGIVVFNGVKIVVVDVAWTLKFCFYGVTHEWMPSIFEVLFLFWFVVIFLLSSWYEIDVPVELLAGDVWSAEDDKIGFLSVGMDIFDQLYLKERPISLPMVQISAKKTKIW